MKLFKPLILFVSLFTLSLTYAMDGGMDSDASGKLGLALSAAKKNPGLLVAAGLVAGAGIYLYKTARGTHYVIPKVTLEQVQVLNQFASPEHGGSASCGYQALKNALFIAKQGMPESCDDDVCQVSFVQQLFGKNEPKGIWRKLVIENSYKRAIKWMLDAQLYSVIIPYKQLPELKIPDEVKVLDPKNQARFKEKLRGYYQGILGDELSVNTVNRLMHDLKDRTIYSKLTIAIAKIDLAPIIKSSSRVMDRDIDGLKEFNFEEYAKNDEVIHSYLPTLLDGNFLKWEITKAGAVQAYNSTYPNCGFDVQGDWIQENEIQLLVESEKKQYRLLTDMPASFDGNTVIDNVLLLDKGEGLHKEVKEIAERLARSTDFIHCFEVGLMNGEPGKESGERHWITLVVHKHDGKTIWKVADSGGNASRLKDPIVWTLIKHLTQKV